MRRTVAVAAGAAILVAGASGGAGAAHLVGSPQIRDNSVRSVDIRNGTLGRSDLRPALGAGLSAALSRAGRISGYQVLGDRTVVIPGDADGRHAWRMPCPLGEVAVSGGQRYNGNLVDLWGSGPYVSRSGQWGWFWFFRSKMDPSSETNVWVSVDCVPGTGRWHELHD